LSWIERY